jgi:hypothetical protein
LRGQKTNFYIATTMNTGFPLATDIFPQVYIEIVFQHFSLAHTYNELTNAAYGAGDEIPCDLTGSAFSAIGATSTFTSARCVVNENNGILVIRIEYMKTLAANGAVVIALDDFIVPNHATSNEAFDFTIVTYVGT